jgi:transcriptional regulator GlxA family with amidase domain
MVQILDHPARTAAAEPSRRPSSVALRTVYGPTPGRAQAQLRVIWGFEGWVEIDLDGPTARVAPGHSLVIAPGHRHAFADASPGARCFVVDSHDERQAERLLPVAGQVRANDPALGYLLRYLAAQPAWSPAAAELLLGSAAASTEVASRPASRPIDWSALLAWIDGHLAQVLDVPALAGQVHLSPTQFAARCSAECGLTPMALVRRQRLAAALRLRGSGMPVALAAARSGYRSPSALTAALKRQVQTR